MKEGYLPLYRKYRPQKLEDIVGQAHIKRALKNAIELNKISHAYLFTGPRGTGKTSTARILAKSLNCVNGPTVTPCEECESCKSIINTIPIDVIEIDAASNRSVDDAHEILEKVNYAPVQGKFKIYIIDEVHMLTVQAFNALLKTLEEPPENVIFILATTEAHKVLDTIKSRCQRFDFKRITTSDIIEHLKKIALKENIKITDGAISVIAKSSAGGMRDSLALLDQVSSLGANEEITETDINNLLGRLSFPSLYELVSYIINSDGSGAITVLEKIYNDGNEPLQILTNLLNFFRNLLIVKNCSKDYAAELTEINDDDLSKISELASNLEKHQIISLINKTSDYIKEVKESTNQQLWLEVALIDISNLADNTKIHELEARLERLEGGGVTQSAPVRISAPVQKPIEPVQKPVSENVVQNSSPVKENVPVSNVPVQQTPVVAASAAGNNDLSSLWLQILQVLLKDNLSGLASMKAMTALVQCDKEGIVVVGKTPTFTEKLNMPDKRQKLIEAIYSVIGESDAPVIIRPRTPDDDKIKKIKPAPVVKAPAPVQPNVSESEVDEDEQNNIQEIKSLNNTNADDIGLNDQAKMVKSLFDGKVLE